MEPETINKVHSYLTDLAMKLSKQINANWSVSRDGSETWSTCHIIEKPYEIRIKPDLNLTTDSSYPWISCELTDKTNNENKKNPKVIKELLKPGVYECTVQELAEKIKDVLDIQCL